MPNLDLTKFKPTESQGSLDLSTFKPIDSPEIKPQSFSNNLIEGTQNIIKDITGEKQNQSKSFIPNVIQSTIGSKGLAGVAQLPGRVASAISEYGLFGIGGQNQASKLESLSTENSNNALNLIRKAQVESDPEKRKKLMDEAKSLQNTANETLKQAKEISGMTDTTGGEALGTTLNAGLTALTGAKPNVLGSGLGKVGLGTDLSVDGVKALQTLKKGTSFIDKTAKATYYGGKALENAAIGSGYQIGNNLTNGDNTLKGVGTASVLGAVTPFVGTALSGAKNALLEKSTPAAEIAINSLIKPLGKEFAYGKNPARGIINEGITANTFGELAPKVSEKLNEVGGNIGKIGDLLDQTGVVLDLTPGLKPIDEAINQAAKSNNTALFNSLSNVKTALMHTLSAGEVDGAPAIIKGEAKNLIGASYKEAKNFLSDIAEHTRFTGNPSDDKSLNMATKKAYGVVRDIMNKSADSVDPSIGNEIRNLNERYADLLSAKSAINHRDIVLKRQNILNLADRFSVPVAIAGAVGTGLVTGDWSKAGLVLLSELGTIAGTKAAGSTAVRTRVAQFLSRLAPEERAGILNSTPLLKSYYERLTGTQTPSIDAPKTKTLKAVQNYIKEPALGLSVKSISPESVASKVDGTDIKTIKNYLEKNDITSFMEAMPMIHAMGLNSMEEPTLKRFLKEVIDIKSPTKKVNVSSARIGK